jgi:hypothetical protein
MLPTSVFHEWIILVNAFRPATTGENELLVQITASASSEAEGEALGADESADEDVNERSTAKICFLRVEDHEVVGPELLLINGNIVSSQIILVDALRPAITGENELLVQITASTSSEAEGEALGADEPADDDEDVD